MKVHKQEKRKKESQLVIGFLTSCQPHRVISGQAKERERETETQRETGTERKRDRERERGRDFRWFIVLWP